MIPALLHGKLSAEQENMEDILTSNVFGVLKYVPPREGLVPFLLQAATVGGDRVLQPILGTGDNVEVKYDFWPAWTHEGCVPCEPDVVLTIKRSWAEPLMILVEAKFHSGKSSFADDSLEKPNDQLAKEWDNLLVRAAGERAEPLLIFLTADFVCPEPAMEESLNDIQNKRSAKHLPTASQFLWLSWRCLPDLFGNSTHPALRDLAALCDRLDLLHFKGISPVSPPGPIDYRFRESPFGWEVMNESSSFEWRFTL